ncbi:hypothetical protein LEP1GSC186_1449 [Leptospira noguchii serovar Autumnalis str. ZUN142]|uniref:Uncharacterized protein n=2 Tax=Leptospira noguchii TaxID=28182 RepID=T0FH04_9LEPT|nr:hypothetical protein LEP1GSC186_1449 [Leptospira noguchii serovar Autumnalis str. ZUN142]EQA72583.1 hypothetical protein LEP1GSC059_1390 [Leptospira noguchii serovar Panama str. CZ214]
MILMNIEILIIFKRNVLIYFLTLFWYFIDLKNQVRILF